MTPAFKWTASSPHPYSDIKLSLNSDFTNVIAEWKDYTGLKLLVRDSLSNGTTYYWRVRGKNSAGTGSWSNYNSFVPSETVTSNEQELRLPENFKLEQNYPNDPNPLWNSEGCGSRPCSL